MRPLAATAVLRRAAVRKMLVGVGVAVVLFMLPTPEGLTPAGKNTLVLFALLVYFWATEALPLPVTALGAGVGLMLLGIAEHPNDAWGPYAQDTIFFLLGSLILADAVTKTDSDRVLSARILQLMGGSTDTLLLAIILATALPAMFVSDHAIAAVMVPLVIALLRSTGLLRRPNIAAAYMLAIAFGAAIAGLATPSGGARNAIVIGYMHEFYGIRVGYLEWAVHAVPITLALIPAVFVVLKLVFRVPHERIDRTSLHLEEGPLNNTQRLTLLIIGGTVALWILVGKDIGLGTVAIIGVLALFVLGILDWVDTRRRIAWGVPLIYGAALAMGAQLQTTGAAQWLAGSLLGVLPAEGATSILLAALFVTILLTSFMSDGATTAILAPVTLTVAFLATGAADAFAMEPGQESFVRSMGFVTAIGSAFSFLLVIGTPPNVIAYSSGLFSSRDLAKAGSLLMIAGIGVVALAVTLYWPMLQRLGLG